MPPPDARLVTVLCNPDCPHCTHAVDRMTEWAVEAGVPIAGLDLTRHPEAATRLDLEHSPVVLVEGGRGPRIHVGVPTHDEFVHLATDA